MAARRTGIIYALIDPLTHAVRYIGQTTNSTRRKWQHSSKSNNLGQRKVNQWLKLLFAAGSYPIFIKIEDTYDLDAREVFWVAEHRRRGADLLNMNEGGASLHHAHASPKSSTKTGKHSPLQMVKLRMSQTAASFLKEDRAVEYERALKHISAMEGAIKRAIKREGKVAALARINAQLEKRWASGQKISRAAF